LVLGLLLIVSIVSSAPALAQQAAPAPVNLTPEQMENFLLHAKITRTRSAGNGVTNSERVTLTDGTTSHDAHLQFIDSSAAVFDAGKASEINFKDSYRYNIAGYRVAHLLGLNVPMSVERHVNGKPAAITWWVDDVKMDEQARLKKKAKAPNVVRYQRQVQTMRIFDELIQNRDRNQGNILWTSNWDMWLIDHTRAFRLGSDLLNPKQIIMCDRALYTKLRGLTRESVAAAAGDSLTGPEINALLTRRNAIVKLLDQLIAEKGENAVLYNEPLPSS
jgi:hypothetical protein